MSNKDCIFCKIANKEIPVEFVFENEYIAAFNDANPQAPVHILVIPKKHITSLNEIKEEKIMSELIKGIQEVTKKLNITDYRTVINTGKDAGQTVFHIHAHILAKRELLWPPG